MAEKPKRKTEAERLPEDNTILHFCIDGVRYALTHNDPKIPQEELYNSLKEWFPDVQILPKDIEP